MNSTIPQHLQPGMQEKLQLLYGSKEGEAVFDQLKNILTSFTEENPQLSRAVNQNKSFSEKEIVLITYGDQLSAEGRKPLTVLLDFLSEYCYDTISTVHLLPFFPYSSDDGFSVIDYRRVDPDVGSWGDIEKIGEQFDLMFDAVINHISINSRWFKKFLQGDSRYADYFISADPATDLSGVTRPRANRLLSPFLTASGQRWLWTTFSPDQVDLNYRNPALLLEIIEVLLFYISKKARILRLDAVAYLWKEIGSSCIHLPQTHLIVRLFRSILKAVASDVLMITETNVPHAENISYFGNGSNEAQLVYQFALPPLVLYSFATGNAVPLSAWAASLTTKSEQVTFFNFLASHDGIGLRPVEGILTAEQIKLLVERTTAHGGLVSFKSNHDGSQSPYELNINYFDALVNEQGGENGVNKFMAAQAILLALAGIPGIYIHSLLGSRNDQQGVKTSGLKRRINRQKLKYQDLTGELQDDHSIRSAVLQRFSRLLRIRRNEKAFHPNADQQVLFLDQRLFSLRRMTSDGREVIIALHNTSADRFKQKISLLQLGLNQYKQRKELLSGKEYSAEQQELTVELDPYQVRWIKVSR